MAQEKVTGHAKVETNNFLMIVLILLVVSIGGLVEIVPLFYGPYSVAGEFVYDHPFQWGSKRTGPDLARVGGRYSDDWHRAHLNNPRDVVPESNMPAYPWLERTAADAGSVQTHMRGLRTLGAPYSDDEIAKAPEEVKGKTELDAVIAYLQVMGIHRK